MTLARNVAVAIAGLVVLGQFLASESFVPLTAQEQLAIACVTVIGTFLLLHLPSINDYVIGGAVSGNAPEPVPPPEPAPAQPENPAATGAPG